MKTYTIISTLLPFITICPVTKLPELLYVEIEFPEFMEIYETRNRIAQCVKQKRYGFQEETAQRLAEEFPNATKVSTHYAFSKAKCIIAKEQ